ncbi:MAG: SCO family protein [Pseudomonadota bacterium]
MRVVLVIAVGLLIGAASALIYNLPTPGERPRVASQGEALIGGPFKLVSHTGAPVSDADFRGRHMLVMFGFTHCQDFCPAELQVISAALDKLSAGQRAQLAPLFITIDPERDTQTALSLYIPEFHQAITGLTGTRAQIDEAIAAYRVYARKVPMSDDDPTAYTMDHSTYIYLMGPDGKYIRHFRYGVTPQQLAEALQAQLPAV